MNIFEKPRGVQTRWSSFENPSAGRDCAGSRNNGHKGRAAERLGIGETRTLLDVKGSGTITRLWFTIGNRTPQMLRGLRLEMFWDGAERPAVSCPFGDFFGVGLGRRTAFETALFSDPEGKSFNCFIPMPFRKAARITLTNESKETEYTVFYDVDFLLNVEHSPEALCFHAHWRRESPNALGEDFDILPYVQGNGRFLGCNIGVMADPRYAKAWWGEGEVKVWFGDDRNPTLCGTGAEDYIGTAWGQKWFNHRTQGCLVADEEKDHWAFYRYHIDDPVYFDGGCRVSIQTIGGAPKAEIVRMRREGVPVIPVTLAPRDRNPDLLPFFEMDRPPDLEDPSTPDGWCNFRRQDDWSATAYFYLDAPGGILPPLAPVAERVAGL